MIPEDATNNTNEHNMVKNPNCQGVEPGSTKNKLQFSGQSGTLSRGPPDSMSGRHPN